MDFGMIRVGKAVKGAKVCRQDVGEYSAAAGIEAAGC